MQNSRKKENAHPIPFPPYASPRLLPLLEGEDVSHFVPLADLFIAFHAHDRVICTAVIQNRFAALRTSSLSNIQALVLDPVVAAPVRVLQA